MILYLLHFYRPDSQNSETGAKPRQFPIPGSESTVSFVVLELLSITFNKFPACQNPPSRENYCKISFSKAQQHSVRTHDFSVLLPQAGNLNPHNNIVILNVTTRSAVLDFAG